MHSEKLLNADEVSHALASVYALSEHWLSRAPKPLDSYTLGAATYLDANRQARTYEQLCKKTNPLLISNFEWLYEKLIEHLSRKWGMIQIDPELAHPGFHIFGAAPGQLVSDAGCRLMEQPLASVHVDAPYRLHMPRWSEFENVDFLNPLSITLCLSLPRTGGGLNMWQALEQKMLVNGHSMVNCHFDRHRLSEFQYIPYQPGYMYVSSGHKIHQIAPANPMQPDDRRITMQAHAVKCDGVWQLFF